MLHLGTNIFINLKTLNIYNLYNIVNFSHQFRQLKPSKTLIPVVYTFPNNSFFFSNSQQYTVYSKFASPIISKQVLVSFLLTHISLLATAVAKLKAQDE